MNKEKDITGRVLANVLCFIAGIFSVYGLIGFTKSRILNSLEYANFKTLDYKIELIKAYQEYHAATKQLIMDNLSAVKVEQKVDSLENLEGRCE